MTNDDVINDNAADENPYKNVVLFPKIKKDTPPLSLENIVEKISENQSEVIDSLSEQLARNVFGELDNIGYDFFSVDKSVAYDMILVLESIKSLQHKLLDKEYPLQTILDDVFKIEDEASFISYFVGDEFIFEE